MARLARVVLPEVAHHVTQRGNRRQRVFFAEKDYQEYIRLMSEWCGKHDAKILAYCLMPNHVHLIALPRDTDGLAKAMGEAHRRYTRNVNFSKGWRGHLWQGRFASFLMSPLHLRTAVKYVEMNPVRAKLCKEAWDYRWSNAQAHVKGEDDDLVDEIFVARLEKELKRPLKKQKPGPKPRPN